MLSHLLTLPHSSSIFNSSRKQKSIKSNINIGILHAVIDMIKNDTVLRYIYLQLQRKNFFQVSCYKSTFLDACKRVVFFFFSHQNATYINREMKQ